jgi:hypothetical protein
MSQLTNELLNRAQPTGRWLCRARAPVSDRAVCCRLQKKATRIASDVPRSALDASSSSPPVSARCVVYTELARGGAAAVQFRSPGLLPQRRVDRFMVVEGNDVRSEGARGAAIFSDQASFPATHGNCSASRREVSKVAASKHWQRTSLDPLGPYSIC